jgi:UDP-2-acetamido-2-deoxy-ribo-hexuluronate aminotransferase
VTDVPFFAGARTWARHGERHLALIAGALAAGRALQGDAVAAFEDDLAAYCERRHAIAVGNGTDALFFALGAAGVGPGDEVLVPAQSFIATASCVVRAGATPVFVDVDEHVLIDLDAAQAAVTPRTRAVIAVGLYGQMVDPAALEALGARHGLVVIEDLAQSPGASVGARRSGAVGELGCLSFDPTKTLAAPGSGGAVVCDDDALAAHVRRLRWHGRGSDGRIAELGYNSQLPSGSAAVLADKLTLDAQWTARRQAIAAAYDDALAASAARPVGVAAGREHVRSKYVVRSGDRDGVRERLGAAGVPTLVHYPVALPDQPLFGQAPPGDWPHARRAAGELLSLPIHAMLTDVEVAHVADSVRTATA